MPQRRIRATKLAAKLAEGLSAVVPAEMEVSLAGPVVSLGERGRRAGMAADLRPEPDPPEASVFDRAPFLEIADVACTLEGVLDQFQDEVAETIAEPWPAVAPGPMPEPFVELREGRLVAGYGDPADPALTVLSVTLHDLR